jgi:hypothetical protein
MASDGLDSSLKDHRAVQQQNGTFRDTNDGAISFDQHA